MKRLHKAQKRKQKRETRQQEPTGEWVESARRGPPPGYKKRRVVYKVERLPEELRTLLERGLAEGKSFERISQEVTEAGTKLSATAVSHYWRYRWLEQSQRLKAGMEQAGALALALRQAGESNDAVLARKMLLGAVLSRLGEFKDKEVSVFDILREAREMVKATKHLDAKPKTPPPLRTDEMQERIRQIYGWPEEKPASKPPSGG